MLHALTQMFHILYHILCNIRTVASLIDVSVIDLISYTMGKLIVRSEESVGLAIARSFIFFVILLSYKIMI